MGWIEILMEDILRLAKEKGSPPTVEDVMRDSGVTREEVKEAVKELKKKGLATMGENGIVLTEKGEKMADIIYIFLLKASPFRVGRRSVREARH